MELDKVLFQFEVNTKIYGKLFFKIYPDDEKDEVIYELMDNNTDDEEICKILFQKLYARSDDNHLSEETINLSDISSEEKKEFLKEFFYRQFCEYKYDEKLSIRKNINSAEKFEREQSNKNIENILNTSIVGRAQKELNRYEKMLGYALNGNSLFNISNSLYQNSILETERKIISQSMMNAIPKIYTATPCYTDALKVSSSYIAKLPSYYENNVFSNLESAISKLNSVNEPWLGSINDYAMPFSKQLDALAGYKNLGFSPETFNFARDYIPDTYSISRIYKDIFSDVDIYIKNKEDDDEPEYRLNDIRYDKGFIDFLHNIPEKDVLRFLTHLQDFPYLALLDDVGKQIFDSVQSRIMDYTKIVSNQIFYRARAKEKGQPNWTPNQIGQPHYGVPSMGRYNFLGKPYFYVTSDESTARKEVENEDKPESTVMKMTQISEMKIFDISAEDCPLVTYCNIDKKDGNDYTPYLVPSFLSVCCAYLNKKKRHSVDAIKYKSVKNKTGFCYVIIDKAYNDFFDDGEIVGV